MPQGAIEQPRRILQGGPPQCGMWPTGSSSLPVSHMCGSTCRVVRGGGGARGCPSDSLLVASVCTPTRMVGCGRGMRHMLQQVVRAPGWGGDGGGLHVMAVSPNPARWGVCCCTALPGCWLLLTTLRGGWQGWCCVAAAVRLEALCTKTGAAGCWLRCTAARGGWHASQTPPWSTY